VVIRLGDSGPPDREAAHEYAAPLEADEPDPDLIDACRAAMRYAIRRGLIEA
jgi:hypothetical protein